MLRDVLRIDCQYPGLGRLLRITMTTLPIYNRKVDALKQTVDVSTAEALKALQEASRPCRRTSTH